MISSSARRDLYARDALSLRASKAASGEDYTAFLKVE
jgi:hypothetical protein